VRPPGPFGASGVGSALTIGAPGSSFCPENTQIEFACSGPAVGFLFPVSSPANAALAPMPVIASTQVPTKRKRLMCPLPFSVDASGVTPDTLSRRTTVVLVLTARDWA
jgi:hypothetical protein